MFPREMSDMWNGNSDWSRGERHGEAVGYDRGYDVGHKKGYQKGYQQGSADHHQQMIEKLSTAPAFSATYSKVRAELKELNAPTIAAEEKKLADEFGKCKAKWFFKTTCKNRKLAERQTALSRQLRFYPSAFPATAPSSDHEVLAAVAKDEAKKDYVKEALQGLAHTSKSF